MSFYNICTECGDDIPDGEVNECVHCGASCCPECIDDHEERCILGEEE